jgi:hypothetical protein
MSQAPARDNVRVLPVDANGDEIIEKPANLASLAEGETRGMIDVQIATARRYPRSIKVFRDTALEMATLDEATAEACFYSLPRGGKAIEGPSARLAEICASAWGHMRIESRIVDQTDRFITARGTAWDVQNNVAVAVEVRRRITDREGRTFSDDMIVVTGNAVSSIALRNAVFKVIPSAYTRSIYQAARQIAIGDAKTLASKRADMLAYFGKMGVTEKQVLAIFEGAHGIEDITLENLATLKGLATAIKDGDTTIEEAFKPREPEGAAQSKTASVAAALREKAAREAHKASAPAPQPKPTQEPEQPAEAPQVQPGATTVEEIDAVLGTSPAKPVVLDPAKGGRRAKS